MAVKILFPWKHQVTGMTKCCTKLMLGKMTNFSGLVVFEKSYECAKSVWVLYTPGKQLDILMLKDESFT